MTKPREVLNKKTAGEAASSLSVNIKPAELATRARKVLREKGIHTIPVTENGKLEGILKSQDLLEITSTQSNIKVAGLMTTPIFTATPDLSLRKLSEETIELNLYLAPVIKSTTDKTLLGVVRLEDILKEIEEFCGEEPKIEEIMTANVVKTSSEEEISKVWNRMEEGEFSGIPVVKGDKPVGMITRSDILKSGKARLAVESKKGRTPPKVKTIMHSPTVSISPDSCIGDGARLMVKHDIGRLPVTKNERLIGIVDREDIIRYHL